MTASGVISWHVEGAYNPSDRGSSAGGNHIVLDAPIHYGRLRRAKGDALCKPSSKFWGLTGPENREIDCHHCIRTALHLGMGIDARAALDLGSRWYGSLIVRQGLLSAIEFRTRPSRWTLPPPVPPQPDRLLQAVRPIAPWVKTVRVSGAHSAESSFGSATIE